MEKLDIDTDKLKEQGQELKSISSDLSNMMNEMYGKLTNVQEDGVWSSEGLNGSAQTFINTVNVDKNNNFNLCKNMYKVGSVIEQYSNSIGSSSDTEIRR